MAAMRERLITELQLSADQQAKLTAIGEEMRPQFMALRDLPEADRPAAREKISMQMRQKISAMLDTGQRAKYTQMVAAAAGQGGAASAGGAAAPATAPAPGAPGVRSGAAASALPSRAASAQAGAAASPGATTPAATQGSALAPAVAVAAPGGSGGPGGGPLMDLRNRLIGELQLSSDQLAKVDAVIADSRPRYMALRELAAEERPKARERITADLRARIGDLLTPEQKAKYAVVLAESSGRAVTRGRIYLLGADGKPKAYSVRLGISDGTSTELIVLPGSAQSADLIEGAIVITGTAAPSTTPAARGPRMSF